MAVDAPHTAALQVADDVFGELVRLGRVSVAVGLSNDTHPQPIIEVRPANSLACSVAILAMDAQIDLLLGPHETLREIYSRKASERLQELRQCLEAVAEGRYEENGRGYAEGRDTYRPLPRRPKALRPLRQRLRRSTRRDVRAVLASFGSGDIHEHWPTPVRYRESLIAC